MSRRTVGKFEYRIAVFNVTDREHTDRLCMNS
jgi:hypothetical protein